MKTNKVKRKLKRGEVALGTLVFEFDSPGLPRLCELAGAEFVIFDMEHTRFTIERITELLAWSRGCDLVPLVRPPDKIYHLMSRPMDAGAMGLMLPSVDTPEQAREIVNAVKYAPLGNRGTGFGMAHDNYLAGDTVKTMRQSNRESMVLAQIETGQGVENVDDILSVEGVDVAWVGHNDLAQSLGIPGDFENPRFQKAMDRVAEAAERRGAIAGRSVGSTEEALAWIGRGYQMLTYSRDSVLFQSALQTGLDTIRAGLTK